MTPLEQAKINLQVTLDLQNSRLKYLLSGVAKYEIDADGDIVLKISEREFFEDDIDEICSSLKLLRDAIAEVNSHKNG